MIYFGLSLFGAIFFCKPENSDDAKIYQFVIHIAAALVLLISSILYFVGASRLKYKIEPDDYYYDDPYYEYYLQVMINTLNNQIFSLIDNISKFEENYKETSKSLTEIANKYDKSFSSENTLYQKSFNNLYQNPKVNQNLKKSLQSMDSSKNDFISKITIFSKNYHNFIQSIKIEIMNFYKSIFEPSENIIQMLNDDILPNERDRDHIIYKKIANDILGYVTAGSIILLVIVFAGAFCTKNCCSICLFSTFSLYAIIILILGYVGGLFISKNNYQMVMDDCRLYINQNSYAEVSIKVNNLKNEISDSLKMFNDHSKINIKIEDVLNNLNSGIIHKDYQSIYSQYSRNHQYRNFLNDIILTIKDNEEKVTEMKTIIQDVKEFTNSIVLTFNNIQYDTLSLIEKVNESYEYYMTPNVIDFEKLCSRYHSGCNLCAVATILLYIGLIVMSITVCLRRRDMSSHKSVGNSGSGSGSGKAAQKSKSEEEADISFDPDAGIQEKYNALLVEDNKPLYNGHFRNGILGPGFYFSEDPGTALYRMLEENKSVNVNNRDQMYAIIKFKVNLGCMLIVSPKAIDNFVFDKNTLLGLNCNSVCGHAIGSEKVFVVYDEDQFEPIDYNVFSLGYILDKFEEARNLNSANNNEVSSFM